MKDFYYILGTHSNCTAGEITEAYSKLSKKFAPTSNEHDYFLESHFREISEAYEILSDPTRRRKYDEALRKTHQKQITNFKAKHMNLALTGVLILFTGLFGFYVVRTIKGNQAAKPLETIKVAEAAPVVTHKIKHRKKRWHAKVKAAPVAVVKPPVPAVKMPAIVTAKPTVIKKDTVKAVTLAKAIQPAPVPAKTISPTAPLHVIARVDSSYTTSLKNNLSGTVYLHQSADYMSAVVTVVQPNAQVQVLAKGKSFYKISYNNQVGYIPRWMVTRQ